MDNKMFVQTVDHFCSLKNVSHTVACRESGAGERLIENVKKGSKPSVEKVQLLAQYLGVTVSELLGETPNTTALSDLTDGTTPEVATLHDSAVVVHPTDAIRLTVSEVRLILAYREAVKDDRQAVESILRKYKKGTVSDVG